LIGLRRPVLSQVPARAVDYRAMIAYVSCVGDQGKYERLAVPGLRRVDDGDAQFGQLETSTSIHEAYNEALDHYATDPALEALVLLHEDVELFDPATPQRIRAAVADPNVAVVGAIGARGIRSLAWWDYEVAGRAYETRGVLDRGFDDPVVDAVDGLLLILSSWAVRNLRFDTDTFTGFHAYDMDICFSARAAGRRVEVADILLMHHTKTGYGDQEAWKAANALFRAKWGLRDQQLGQQAGVPAHALGA